MAPFASTERGPIEAINQFKIYLSIAFGFPRSSERGPIEAKVLKLNDFQGRGGRQPR